MRSKRRPDITEDEVLANQVWNLGYLLDRVGHLIHARTQIEQPLEPGKYEMVIEHIEDFSMEMHPQVYVAFKLVKVNDERSTDTAPEGAGPESAHEEITEQASADGEERR